METIKNYVENLFLKLPHTADVLRAKAELVSMMEDKYNELKNAGKSENEAIGVVISEFGNIDELINELGINDKTVSGKSCRFVTKNEVLTYLSDKMNFAKQIALGVFLCIISPILIIFLTESSKAGYIDMSEDVASAIGAVVLFVIICVAVVIFILSAFKYSKYDNFSKDLLDMDYSTKDFLQNGFSNFKPKFAVSICIGVALCIMSVTPFLIIDAVIKNNAKEDTISSLFCCIFLIIVAVAVVIFIISGVKYDSYAQLLQLDEYSIEKKKNSKLIDSISGIYWPLVVASYLAWSFIGNAWNISWVLWPICGVVFAAICGIANIISGDDNNKYNK